MSGSGSDSDRATIVLVFPGWRWRSYTGTVPAALVALDSQVFFPGDVARGFRFEMPAAPGVHSLTVILGGNARTVGIEVEAGRTYEVPLRFGGRWGALKIDFPRESAGAGDSEKASDGVRTDDIGGEGEASASTSS